MEFKINYEDMQWTALSPEFTLFFTALFLLLIGLKEQFNANKYLAKATLVGIAISFFFSLALWGSAPTIENSLQPDMFSKSLIHDKFGQGFNIIFLLMATYAVLGASRYPHSNHENKSEYFALILLTVVGMMFLAKSGNLITAFISLEIFSISLYILCGFSAKHGTGKESPTNAPELKWATLASQESTVKYLLTGAFASAILVYGMALIYAGTGTTEIRFIGQLLHCDESGECANPYSRNTLVYIGMGLLFSGLAFKISLVPFHSWTPDVYQGAPTPITGFMSVATKAAAFALIARIFFTAFSELNNIWMPFMFGISVITMLVGNIAAIFQDDVKRMLAYSGVAHAGYLLIGIVANSQDGIASLIFYLYVYLFMNIGAFSVIFIMEGEGKEGNSIFRFKGLAKKHPLIAGAMSLFMLSLAGFPPTAGFFGKLYVFMAAIKEGYILITIAAVIATVVSVYFYLRIIVLMYFHENEKEEVVVVHRGIGGIIALSSIAIILIGLFPSRLMSIALESIPF
ncbi:MAG: NADH-quinone oxidoreductase subunit N [Nitrospina sp.]|jgi:NADH-quinone oxidoreductase subunit N|nr:NADH-quinone oxidoreductase subunit N [Nitrospina sp.]MBT6600728.1 NADH-quinone oxidoreductase subunit N [Nitrospina sp.]